MTTEKLIANLYKMACFTEGYDSPEFFGKLVKEIPSFDASPGGTLCNIAGLIHELEIDLNKAEAKKAGKLDALKAAKNILKLAQSANPNRCAIHYAQIIDGIQNILSGFHGVCLVEGSHLPMEEMPDSIQDNPINLYRMISENFKREIKKIDLPDLAKLKAYIKLEKAKNKGNKQFKGAVYDYGYDSACFKAQYLADVMEILPEAKAYITGLGDSTLLFKDDHGNTGLILGIRHQSGEVRLRTEL